GGRIRLARQVYRVQGFDVTLPIAFRGRCPDEKHIGEQTARAVRLRRRRAARPRIARRDAPTTGDLGDRCPLIPFVTWRYGPRPVAMRMGRALVPLIPRGDGPRPSRLRGRMAPKIYLVNDQIARTNAFRLGRPRKVVLEK